MRISRPFTFDPFRGGFRRQTDEEVAADVMGLGGPGVNAMAFTSGGWTNKVRNFFRRAPRVSAPAVRAAVGDTERAVGRGGTLESRLARRGQSSSRNLLAPLGDTERAVGRGGTVATRAARRGQGVKNLATGAAAAAGTAVLTDALIDDEDGGDEPSPRSDPEFIIDPETGLPVRVGSPVGNVFRAIASNPFLTLASLVVAGAALREAVTVVQLNDKARNVGIGRHVDRAGEALMFPADALRAPVEMVKAIGSADVMDRLLDSLGGLRR